VFPPELPGRLSACNVPAQVGVMPPKAIRYTVGETTLAAGPRRQHLELL
jgi:hypothetical protein